MTYTAEELKYLELLQDRHYACPICNKAIHFELDSDDEYEYFKGDCYHPDCVNDEMVKLGRKYIIERCEQEYAEWYLNCRFEHYALEQEILDFIMNDDCYILQFINEDNTGFLEWLNE